MERPPLRAGAAATGTTRPSGQQGTQEISFFFCWEGWEKRSPPRPGCKHWPTVHPSQLSEAGQYRTPLPGSEDSQEESQDSALCL